MNDQIAVIGLGCRYPGASNPLELWENIISKRQQFRKMPDGRLPLDEYFHSDPEEKDKTYGQRAAVIDGFVFDWVNKRIPKKSYESTDIVHWLALEAALQAIEDAGYGKGNIAQDRTGVILGNTLTGEESRTSNMRLRWPYVRKVLEKSALAQGFERTAIEELSQKMESYYKSVFPEVTEDSLSGGLSNTIAGRICNYLDLHGGGYVVDGACASSLIAVHTAANALASGQMDMVITGGVDVSLDTFELIGFAKTGALTKDQMRVYDKRGKGFIPGEGAGFVVLKRLEDARADGNKIYSILNGWGVSSDGKGGLTAPSSIGQGTALSRAYEMASYNIQDVDFIEGHGTGTAVGDKVELEGIVHAMTLSSEYEKVKSRSIGMTSFKSIVGHTKAAAGIGAFIKTAIALNRRVIPPTAGCEEPHSVFHGKGKSLYPVLKGEQLSPNTILRAGVSAMGFGGINCHVTMESGDKPNESIDPIIDEKKILASFQLAEIIVLSANSAIELIERVSDIHKLVEGISVAELVDLSELLCREVDDSQEYRASLLVSSPQDCLIKLDELRDLLKKPLQKGENLEHPNLWLSRGSKISSVGFVFSGQGSQLLNMGQQLIERYDWAKELAIKADEWATEVGTKNLVKTIFRPVEKLPNEEVFSSWNAALSNTEIAQPGIVLCSLLWRNYLEKLGITSTICVGHSLGELSALCAAGAFDDEALIKLATVRGQAMSPRFLGNDGGKMISLGCSKEVAIEMIGDVSGYVVVANVNSPKQTVLSGDVEAINEVSILAKEQGIRVHILPVSNAFHSKIIADAGKYLDEKLPIENKFISIEGDKFRSGISGEPLTKREKLSEYLVRQMISPVDFISLTTALTDSCEIAIEVGPGDVLSRLVEANQSNFSCLNVESRSGSGDAISKLVAQLFVRGVKLNFDELFVNRFVRPFVSPLERSFYENPCERPLVDSSNIGLKMVSSLHATSENVLNPEIDIPEDQLKAYLKRRSSFISNVIRADMESLHIMDDVSTANPNIIPLIDNKRQNLITNSVSYEDKLLAIVSEFTGFPADSLSLSMRLLDDLNMDSIKAEALITEVSRKFSLPHDPEDNSYANVSLEEIVSRIVAQGTSVNSNTAQLENTEQGSAEEPISYEDGLFAIVSEFTGFPADSLSLSMRLLDDLNMDSIKAEALITEVSRKYNLPYESEDTSYANASLEEIVSHISVAKQKLGVAPVQINEALITDMVLEIISEKTGFPTDSLNVDMHLLDDLNMDSIKSGELLSDALMGMGLSNHEEFDTSAYANASIIEISNELQKWAESKNSKNVKEVKRTTQNIAPQVQESLSWVRAFTMKAVSKPQSVLLEEVEEKLVKLAGQSVLIYSLGEVRVVSEIIAIMELYNIKCDHVLSSQPLNDLEKYNHCIFVAAENIDGDSLTSEVNDMVIFLSGAGEFVKKAGKTATSISFIQFDPGHVTWNFDDCLQPAPIESSSTYSFAASIHHENPHLQVCSINLDPSINSDVMAKRFIEEFVREERFNCIGYSAECERYSLQVEPQILTNSVPRNINWNEEDVILVTGGAKGITAECALRFAEKYKVKMALIGSSEKPDTKENDHPINLTLARYKEKGRVAQYYSCDISDEQTVAKVIQKVNVEFGKVTGVIHGAGANVPRRIEQLDASMALREVTPKVVGALNLYHALVDNDIKLVVGMTSIIGVTGMPGNSWYAFSNEALNQILNSWRSKHPSTQTLSLAYSVWDEVGMGARMGSVKGLAKMGIGAVPASVGINHFMRQVEMDHGVQQSVITARLGDLDSWPSLQCEMPNAQRYIENILTYEYGVEVISRVELSLETDKYLKDHSFNGSYLFPTVFGLEAMAQVCAYALGLKELDEVVFEDIRLEKPIVVSQGKNTRIQIQAIVDDELGANLEKRVKVSISTEQSNYQNAHFSAVMVLSETSIDQPAPKYTKVKLPDVALDLIPKVDLYGGVLFQGKSFQRLDQLFSMNSQGSVFKTKKTELPENAMLAFDDSKPCSFILGDPYCRDTLLQCILLSVTGQYLPVKIERLSIYSAAKDFTGFVIGKGNVFERTNKDVNSTVIAIDENGTVLEFLEGYRAVKTGLNIDVPTPEEIVLPLDRDLRLLSNHLNNASEEFGIDLPQLELMHFSRMHEMSKQDRHVIELPLFKNAVTKFLSKDGNSETTNFSINWYENGKPYLEGDVDSNVDISLSHDDRTCIAIAGHDKQGCDIIEPIERSWDQWCILLGTGSEQLLSHLITIGDTMNVAGIRLWSVLEAGRKALGTRKVSLHYEDSIKGDVLWTVHTESGSKVWILSSLIFLTRATPKMIALTVHSKAKAEIILSIAEQ